MSTLSEVRAAAFQLTNEEREELGWELVGSVPKEDGYEEAWANEIGGRIEEIDSGKVKMIPGDEVMRRLRAKLDARGL
jgi:putative addiction module component (TIGR02574 family)